VWLVAHTIRRPGHWRLLVLSAGLTSLVAAGLASPTLLWFWDGLRAAGASFHTIEQVNQWGVSINSLPLPFVGHPVLRPLVQRLYQGPGDETHVANLGLLASLLALFSLPAALRQKRWLAPLLLVAAGVVLALGLTLKWDGSSFALPALRPLNELIWGLGHRLKPEFFIAGRPPDPFGAAVPLPGLLLAAVVPYWEGARVMARYLLLAGLGLFLLAGFGLSRLRHNWLKVFLSAGLLFEIVPHAQNGQPFPPQSHPAFAWLQQPAAADGAVIDLQVPAPHTFDLAGGGAIVWATYIHDRPTMAGTSAFFPDSTTHLRAWLLAHPHPFDEPDFAAKLRNVRVRFLVVHMGTSLSHALVAEASGNKQFGPPHCLAPAKGPSPWLYPICIIEVLSPT
ncbi:MAG: hypothetical protein ACRDHL_13440, partial [Candidatus Promineifilaceae bacterium]